jgi:hypothetical protein
VFYLVRVIDAILMPSNLHGLIKKIRALLGVLELKNHNRELEFEGLAKADCVNQCADFIKR